MQSRALVLVLVLLTGACRFAPQSPLEVQTEQVAPTVPAGVAFDLDWKQRLDQPYVFLELLGDYADARRQLATLARQASAQGVTPSGPPFALFFDDPSVTAADRCRSRVCWPVAATTSVAGTLGFDVLSSEPVAYGFVRGAYSDLETAYGDVFSFMRERNWVLSGPIREIYHVDPGTVRGPGELIAELQMPWRPL
jgi:effector-binding domain-containing protein